MIEIPLNNNPEQLFSIVLNGIKYDCRVILNSRTSIWTISFSISGVPILQGVPMLGGIDILEQYPEINIKNMYAINLDNVNLDTSVSGLGTTSKLLVLTDNEINNV